MEIAGLQIVPYNIEFSVAKFDLLLALSESTSGLLGEISYALDLFRPETIHRLVSHLRLVLEKMVANPEQRIGELCLLGEQEKQQVLVEWNQTERKYVSSTIHELFAEQAARTPEAVSVVCGEEKLSYEELNRRANQLGHYLRQQGVGPEVRVAVCLERSVEMVVALLGVLKAGGAYVPLDPAYPEERLKFMVEDSEAAVLLTESRFVSRFANSATRGVVIDEEREQIEQQSNRELSSATTAQNLAYVIYTSGSTGRPKGVAITHGSANVLLHWGREVFGEEELKGVLASTSICFDLSIFELFLPLSWGGTVLLVENALELPEWIENDAVKLVNTVPSAMTELLRMGGVPTSVRVVNLAGEALQRSLVDGIYRPTKAERVVNLYGPSEDTTYSTYEEVRRERQSGVAIGIPIANTEAYVLDEGGQPLPAGVAGELYLGGAGLARGYLNRPELTAERFVPHGFSQVAGQRLYRTGDRVRWNREGRLEFLGRMDHQVKVRGYRIELGEIEKGLQRRQQVAQAVVVAREDGSGGKQLVGYVGVEGKREEFKKSEVLEFVRRELPEYMVPSALVVLEELPLTPNGKVDRKALPEPDFENADTPRRSPRNAEEETLAGLVALALP